MSKQATLSILCALGVAGSAPAQEKGEALEFEYTPPVVEKSFFDDSIGMFEQERRDYATNLAVFAGNQLVAEKADADAVESARRMLALALHLDRRNKQALVVNFQLKRGVLPEVKKGDYDPRTFSRLLHSRAKLLMRKESEQEHLLARCFTELASCIDPRNEDAVFAHESQRLDLGEVDWQVLTNAPADPDAAGSASSKSNE